MIAISRGTAPCYGCGAPIELAHMRNPGGGFTMLGLVSLVERKVWLACVVKRDSTGVELAFACSETCATLVVETSGK
jgi:hypothetical protein